MKRLAVILLLLFGAGSLSAQDSDAAAALSRMDEALNRATEDFTPEDRYFIGRAAAANLLDRYRPYTENPALIRYLNLICNALAVNSSAPECYNGYHVMILDSPVFNAFSTSAGLIFITRGLTAAAASEDMLAAVIAHELAHIQLEHGIEAVRHVRLVEDLQSTANTAARLAARDASIEEKTLLFKESVAGMIDTLLQNGFSQTQELDADSRALSLLAAAGYDPRSLAELFKILAREQPGQAGGFDTTHPLPSERISAVEKNIGAYRVVDTKAFRRDRFIRIMNERR